MHKICTYVWCDTDGGPVGMGYHYFTPAGLGTYVYEHEPGRTDVNENYFYSQSSDSPWKFICDGCAMREPEGNTSKKNAGQFCNPVCRLKMRTSPQMGAQVIGTLVPGTMLKIEKVGDRATIDGISSNWVRVSPVNDDAYLEGNKIKDWFPAEENAAWVFGGYLE